MKVYLALQYYDNGQSCEDHYYDTELIGVYATSDGAMDAIDRMIDDQHTEAQSINCDNSALPEIRMVPVNGTKYRAMKFTNSFREMLTWQYYVSEQEVRD